MQRLTKTFINSIIPPKQGQVIYRDSELPGFGLRVNRKCKSFIVECRVNGVNRRITLGKFGAMPIEQAKREARKILSAMGKGVDPVAEKNQEKTLKVTLSAVLDKFLTARVNMMDTTKLGYRKKAQLYLGDWLELPITQITKDMVEQRHRELGNRQTRTKTDGKPTANTAMEVLRILLTFAADHYTVNGKPIIAENPVDRITLNRQWYPRNARQGVIPDHRLQQWYTELMNLDSKIARDYFLLVLLTGLRRREAAKLKWSDVDFEGRTLNIPQTKNGKLHRLPLTDFLAELLKSRLPSDSEYVFPGRYKGYISEPRQPWAQLRKQTGMNFLIHDLRRVYLTTGEKIGISHYTLKKLANHSIYGSNDPTGAHYVVVTVEDMRPAMNQITERLLELMGCSIESWRLADGSPRVSTSRPGTRQSAHADPEPVYFYVSFGANC